MMFRLACLVLLLALTSGPPSRPLLGQEVATVVPKSRESSGYKSLTIGAAPEASPCFRYSLLPSSARARPGDAAPIYLRLQHNITEADWLPRMEKIYAWSDAPLETLPLDEVKKTLAPWATRLADLAVGARRAACDWSYPLDEQRADSVNIILYDINSLRAWGAIVALKARVEIAEGRFDEACRTLETGLAFGRHVGSGPFLINALIGMSIEHSMLACVEDWVQKPGSPNLYWALTALPRPLVSIRDAMEQERLLVENLIPELASSAEPKSPSAWEMHLKSMYGRMRILADRMFPVTKDAKGDDSAVKVSESLPADVADFKRLNVASFRKQLVASGLHSEAQVLAMADDEATARGIAFGYRSQWDSSFKWAYLPYADASKLEPGSAAPLSGPLTLFAAFQPSLRGACSVEARLDRRVAQLRIVEAIRQHAAANKGQFPESLDSIRETPIPRDPATGEAFALRKDGDHFLLVSPKTSTKFDPDYTLDLRKP